MPINSVTFPLKSTYTSHGNFPFFHSIHFNSNLQLILFYFSKFNFIYDICL